MSNQSLVEARRAEYRQQRLVDHLRRLVYHDPSQVVADEIARRLADAEVELRRLTIARQLVETGSHAGVLLRMQGPDQAAGMLLGPETTGIEAEVLLRQASIPTSVIHLLDRDHAPLVTFRIRNLGEQYIRLRLTSYVEGYSAHAVDTIEIQSDGRAEINQIPTFYPERMQGLNELTRATLQVQIDDLGGGIERHSSFPIWLLARNTACLGVIDPTTGKWVDLAPYLAAWVTPNAPAVTALLRQAADLHPDKVMVGYQTDAKGVEAQVRAVYEAIKAASLVYINSIICYGGTRGEVTQRVRLPRESLANRSANCIDGTVLMASVLEAASLNPALVLVPGHAFLGWEIQEQSNVWDFVETTMIATHEFDAARASGRATAQRQKALASSTGDPYQYRLMALSELRADRGVTPME